MDWGQLWHRQVELLPLLMAVGVSELITFVRRLKRLAYVPANFLFFQSDKLDLEVERYYMDTSFMTHEEPEWNDQQAARLRTKIIWHAIVGVLIYTWVTPIIVALVSATFVRQADVVSLIVVLVALHVYKTALHVADWGLLSLPATQRTKWIMACYSMVLAIAYWINIMIQDASFRETGLPQALASAWQQFFLAGLIAFIVGAASSLLLAELINPKLRTVVKEEIDEQRRLEAEEYGEAHDEIAKD